MSLFSDEQRERWSAGERPPLKADRQRERELLTEHERQQVRQATIEEMLRIAIKACPFCVRGLPKLGPNTRFGEVEGDHFSGSASWRCLNHVVVEAIREASLQP